MSGQRQHANIRRQGEYFVGKLRARLVTVSPLHLAIVVLLALALRLVVWQWRAFYPLGGDEQEYLGQALTLLREQRYVELRLMRPPLYGVFLAGCIYFVDSLVQNLRLVQAIISALTVIPVWLLTREVIAYESPRRSQGVASLAALACALSYTLAVNATELLTETLFVFGLTTFFWLLLKAGRLCTADQQQRPIQRHPVTRLSCYFVTFTAGLVLGALCLTRSVALPLLPLGVLWLILATRQSTMDDGSPHAQLPPARGWTMQAKTAWQHLVGCSWGTVATFALATLLVILPWTARNYATYGGLILIDTTGAENLWLDNDPAGREAVKAQLYALGEDRLARQRLAMQQGLAVIAEDPARFVAKAGGELQRFFALEYIDDMRARPVIWVSPAEVWTRLLLGDGLWLALVLAGTVGLTRSALAAVVARRSPFATPAWLFLAWASYVVLTALIFHVELRYRLPLYPVLLPYAALALANLAAPVATPEPAPRPRWIGCLSRLPALLILVVLLLHRPYPTLLWQLGWKHTHLARAEWALERGDLPAARTTAQAALSHDPDSVLARVALARAAMLVGNTAEAEAYLREAIDVLPDHPHPHLLLGDLLRQRGELAAARRELRYYETASLQDLQTWSWRWFTSPPQPELDIGEALDLGQVRGFHTAEQGGWRWTTDRAQIRLATSAAQPVLHLVLASGRPPDAPPPPVEVWTGEQFVGRFAVASGWRTYALLLPRPAGGASEGQPAVVIELRSDTFTPRDYDRASDDGRTLGVMVDRVELR